MLSLSAHPLASLYSFFPGTKEVPLPHFSEDDGDGKDNMNEGLLLIDAKGRVLGSDIGFTSLLRYAPGEIQGKRYARLFTQAQLQSRAPELALLLAEREGCHVGPVWRQRKGGKAVPLQSRIEVLRNGANAVGGYLEFLEDAENASEPPATTREGEAILLLERKKEGFPRIALAGCDVSWITGWPLAELVGKAWDFLFSEGGNGRGGSGDGETRAALVGAVLGGLPGQGRMKVRRKDGGVVSVFCRIAPLDGGTKQATRMILRLSLLSAPAEAPSRTTEPALISPQMAGGLANEFNNLLTIIMGQSAMVGLDSDCAKAPRLQRIESSILRAASLARHLLLIGRGEGSPAALSEMDIAPRGEGRPIEEPREEGVPFFQELLAGKGRTGSVSKSPGEGNPAAPTEKTEADPGVWPRGTETILIVDDNAPIRRLLSASLRTLGYRVIEVGDRDAALAVIQRDSGIDLLVADVFLPAGSGQEVVHRFRQSHARAAVLYISGYALNPQIEGIVKDEAFLSKPFTPLSLARKIRELLGPRKD